MAVDGGVMVYSGMPACCSPHKPLLLQRVGSLAFLPLRALLSPWDGVSLAGLALTLISSPTEIDQIVQGKLVCALATSFSQCSTFPPPSVLWEGDATWQKTTILITMQCIFQMPSRQ